MTDFEELTCHRCGYSLRGLSRTGVCPECGFAIEHSIRRDHVQRWTRGRVAFVVVWSSIIALAMVLNVHAFGPWSLVSDPGAAAERCRDVWLVVGMVSLLTMAVLTFFKRVPVTMWAIGAVAAGWSFVASAFNHLLTALNAL